ncbi:ribonuclease M5 [Paenibacillus sp. DYY-L-2]|uniref:ribonuclease M5 n=1 Tax=Paenibacillus sp. DYY-L-2 TaxID=3447013 RepID=UPI003F4F6DA4
MIKEVIVVEGRDDTVAVKRAVEADTIETGGSAINETTLRKIELAMERRGVIIFTDPDHAGERIRKIVAQRVPGCKHAFLREADATKGDDIGVENASPKAIREALSRVRSEAVPGAEEDLRQVEWEDLLEAGLIVHEDAAARRRFMGERLGIGYCNGKQFYKRLGIFRISRAEFCDALAQLKNERGE